MVCPNHSIDLVWATNIQERVSHMTCNPKVKRLNSPCKFYIRMGGPTNTGIADPPPMLVKIMTDTVSTVPPITSYPVAIHEKAGCVITAIKCLPVALG